MDSTVSVFGTWRRCCNCKCQFPLGSFFTCSRCKVYTYCSQVCQKSHWKIHKKCCKERGWQTPPDISNISVVSPDDNPQLSQQYKYIILVPGKEGQTKEEFFFTTSGIEEDIDLDMVLSSSQGAEADTVGIAAESAEVVNRRYNWPNGVQVVTTPGFSEDYNGCRLVCFRDEMYNSSAALLPNRTAGYILMQDPDTCRGTYVFCAQHFDENNNLLGFVGLTRKNILDIAEYSLMCSNAGSFPDRLHFENIRRAEALCGLKKQSFEFI